MKNESMESLRDVPTIDLSLLRQNSHTRSLLINEIREACKTYGFFHVINHGIQDSVIEDALNVNARFFDLPKAEKEELISDDVYKVVRSGQVDVGDYSRDFLKIYANPLEQFISLWPNSPHDYRDKMRIYSTEARKLCIELFGAILESLNIEQTHLKQDFEKGIQILGINCYSQCSGSSKKIGIPPHTDHSIITLLLQSSPGLHVVDRVDGSWKSLDELKGSLQVLVGDHLEVISNGLYKSVLHRAIPSCDGARFSIANLHSLAMDGIVEPAAEILERERKQKKYRGSCLRDYLNHHASGDGRGFIETLKIDDDVVIHE